MIKRFGLTVRAAMSTVAAAAILFGYIAMKLAERRAADRDLRQLYCTNSLGNVRAGLENYYEIHGCFPAPFMADDKGRRLHSWRIIVLPLFSMAYPLARGFDYTSRRDSDSDAKLSGRVPGVLFCASEHRSNLGGSPLIMLNAFSNVEPGTIPGNAILMIEAWGANRDWLNSSRQMEK